MKPNLNGILAAAVLSAIGLVGWPGKPVPTHSGAPPSNSVSFKPERHANRQHDPESLRNWADTVDIAAMGALLGKPHGLADEPSRRDVDRALLDSWARRDPGTLGSWFGARNVADVLHQDARDALALRLSQGDVGQTLSWMDSSLSLAVRHEIYGPYFRELTKRDPDLAASKLQALSMTGGGDAMQWNDVVAQVAAQWAAMNLDPALAWARALPEGRTKSAALLQMCPRWVQEDPSAAAAYATARKEPALLRNVAVLWAERDLDGAMAWATTLPSGEGRTAVMARLAGIRAQESPTAAADHVMNIKDANTRDLASIEVVASWASNQPEAAAEWVRQFPEGQLREKALNELLNSWAGHAPEAAARWLQQLAPAHSRDAAVDTFCRLIDSTNPALAFGCAATISDETTRNRRLSEAALFWLEADNQAALVAISQSDLSPAFIQSLLPDFK